MKRLAMIAVTGVMSFMLSACGGDDVPKAPEAQGDDMMQQTQVQAPDDTMQVQAPDKSTQVQAPVTTRQPTEEQIAGATAEE